MPLDYLLGKSKMKTAQSCISLFIGAIGCHYNRRNITVYIYSKYSKPIFDCVQVLILEHLSGGELLQHIHKIERYTEGEAAYLF